MFEVSLNGETEPEKSENGAQSTFMNIFVLINPAAGFHGRELWHEGFYRRLETVPSELRFFVEHTVLGGIKDQIRRMAPKVDRIVVVGGDGTVGAVINGVSELNLPHPVGIIPLGTGNDMARSLGLFENRFWTVDEAFGYVTSDSLKTTPVDVWSLSGSVTFNNYCSLGMDAKIVRGFSRIRSRLQAYPLGAQKGVYFAVYILVWLKKHRIPGTPQERDPMDGPRWGRTYAPFPGPPSDHLDQHPLLCGGRVDESRSPCGRRCPGGDRIPAPSPLRGTHGHADSRRRPHGETIPLATYPGEKNWKSAFPVRSACRPTARTSANRSNRPGLCRSIPSNGCPFSLQRMNNAAGRIFVIGPGTDRLLRW